MKQVKLVIADVDGTLVNNDKQLTERTKEAARKLRDHGIELAITSGRPPRGMSMLVEPLGLTTPIAGFNGGMIVEPDLQTIVQQRTLERELAREVVGALLDGGLDVWVYRGSDWFVPDKQGPHVAREQSTVEFAPEVTDDVKSVAGNAVKIVGVSDDHELMSQVESQMQERFVHQVSAACSQPYYLDVTNPDANKAAVVRDLTRMLDIPAENVAVIGDMPTDAMMFGLAGTSIAMGNASPEVRRCARYVTTSNGDEGFANAIDRFVLGSTANRRPG